ncbi:helicase-exonuclease AddAB subunit AddA [Thermoclostridium caenicola]|uniref:ATP-dependent helicase/nuclease subunit A n=1 Tax=Thermoclostridium caenicola TaxID=659425 RepID=A0A1M6AP33_9FIRM|nr:helicase-exonuclease AddAB subunit AddA [Thermoclostridium caenicola]SHI38264.1 DNA helicase/exodeoxyribonuclease V, subunit A [Thermoclostridium caenicola]
MGNARWTNEQWEAITENSGNLLVAAAAGAGKTAVLVERIIRKITSPEAPVDIDRLLVVTFTNAAATEMRERIGEAISQALEKEPDNRQLQRQLTLLNKACITTIHSFCLEVIRSNFQNLDIDPGFRIADETESTLMKLEALGEVFEEQYEKEDNQDFFELLESYGGNHDDQALMDMVFNLYNFVQSSPWPEARLKEMAQALDLPEGTDFSHTPWGRTLLGTARLELEGLREMAGKAMAICREAEGLDKYIPVLREDYDRIDAMVRLISEALDTDAGGSLREPVWDRVFLLIQEMAFSRMPRLGKDADANAQETVKRLRDDVKAGIRKLRERMFTDSSEQIVRDLKGLFPRMRCLAELASGLAVKYKEKKARKSLVDFNDLEHLCLELLMEKDENGKPSPSPTARAYRERFAEIMVDEYQDSNMVQELIIRMISRSDEGRPNIFMVGDVKQSIYRFRQACPDLFMEKYNTYSPEKGEPYRKILLYRNFRSRREVIDAVNFLFGQIMSQQVGELDYTDAEALHPGAVFHAAPNDSVRVGGEAELHLIQTGEGNPETAADAETQDAGDVETEDEEMLDSIQCEARIIARRIRKLLTPDEEGRIYAVWDKSRGEYRPLTYRDIVILLRTTRNWSEVFTEELGLMGIPVFADTGTGFFKTIEVQVVLSLLQVIDNPLQDIPLLSVLRSPIFSFTTDELAEIRLADRKGLLYHALCKLAETQSGETAARAADFLEKLGRWREMALYMSTDQLIWQLYQETGYYGMVGAMPAGEQRQANLRILYDRARQFEKTSYKGLFNFISFIDKLKSSRGDMGSAMILSENDNVVRIMSIHKSKGLEFPVVFLAGCGKKFNLQDMNRSILLHQDLGFGPDVVDTKLRVSWPSAAKLAIREKIRLETLSEEMRILYVALTRAREKLVITGTVRDAARALERWSEPANTRDQKLPAYEMARAGTYLDWIVPALMRHKGCNLLRDRLPQDYGFNGLVLDDTSRWQVAFWNRDQVPEGPTEEETGETEFFQWLEGGENPDDQNGYHQEIDRRLNWEYPYAALARVQAKFSVTELKRRFDPQLSDERGDPPGYLTRMVKKPLFLEERKGLNAAEKGTVMHFVMQHLNFKNPNLDQQIEDMVSKDLLTRVQADSVDTDKIRRFLDSDLGKRLLACGQINREVPFNIEIPCCELYPHIQGDMGREPILLQGVIDCFFEEPDGLVLIDYKTDRISPGEERTIRDRYAMQIQYYAKALEILTGKKVKERYIYLFYNGDVIAI